MTRKEFLGSLMGAAALFACGGDSDGGGTDAATSNKSCTTNGTSVSIGSNHGHVLTVSAADVAAGVEKTYDITGTSGHAHSVKITAAQFAMLQSNANASLTVTSTGGAHDHTVTIMCA